MYKLTKREKDKILNGLKWQIFIIGWEQGKIPGADGIGNTALKCLPDSVIDAILILRSFPAIISMGTEVVMIANTSWEL